GLRGRDGGRRPRAGRGVRRPRGPHRPPAAHAPRRISLVLLPRSRRQPRAGALAARVGGVTLRRAAAWGVHLLTASSAPAGLAALPAIRHGHAQAAFWWMASTRAVDAVDAPLARAVGVKAELPSVDGSRLDDVVDYFTYVVVPAVFMVEMGVLPAGA